MLEQHRELRDPERVGLGLQLDGACRGVFPLRCPEALVVVAVLVRDVAVELSSHRQFGRPGQAFGGELHQRRLLDDVAEEALEGEAHRGLFAFEHEATGQQALVQVQREGEVAVGAGGQVDALAVDSERHADEARRVDGLAEVIRVAVFPPADDGFIWEPDAAEVRALQVITAVTFFEVTAQAHVAVADGGHAFLQAFLVGVQLVALHQPRVDFKYPFHLASFTFGR